MLDNLGAGRLHNRRGNAFLPDDPGVIQIDAFDDRLLDVGGPGPVMVGKVIDDQAANRSGVPFTHMLQTILLGHLPFRVLIKHGISLQNHNLGAIRLFSRHHMPYSF